MEGTNEVVDVQALSRAIYERRRGRSGRMAELSLRDACAQIGVSAATLSRTERENQPDLPTYVKICRWLGVPFERFLKP